MRNSCTSFGCFHNTRATALILLSCAGLYYCVTESWKSASDTKPAQGASSMGSITAVDAGRLRLGEAWRAGGCAGGCAKGCAWGQLGICQGPGSKATCPGQAEKGPKRPKGPWELLRARLPV